MAFDGRVLDGIGVLAAVVETGNFARAGEALGLTPSGVSRAVARLEARVGVRLFGRTPRAVTLTEEGRRLYARAAPLLSQLEEVTAEAAGHATTVRGRLRVHADAWFAKFALAPHLPAFLAKHPELSVELVVRDALGDLISDGIHVAVRFGEPAASSLIAKKLVDTRIVTCAAPAYLAAHGTPRHPRELARHECVRFRDAASGRPFVWEFHRAKEVVQVKVGGRLLLNDVGTGLMACVAGQGVMQAFEFGLATLLSEGQLQQILPEWADERFPVYAYYPSRQLPPAKVRAFIDFVQEHVLDALRTPSRRPSTKAWQPAKRAKAQ